MSAGHRFTTDEYREITSGAAELMNSRNLHFALKSAIAAVDEERWNIRIPPGHPFWKVYDTYADRIIATLREASPLQNQEAP